MLCSRWSLVPFTHTTEVQGWVGNQVGQGLILLTEQRERRHKDEYFETNGDFGRQWKTRLQRGQRETVKPAPD